MDPNGGAVPMHFVFKAVAWLHSQSSADLAGNSGLSFAGESGMQFKNSLLVYIHCYYITPYKSD